MVADDQHLKASAALTALRARRESLVTTNYVLLEVSALLERRVGHRATREFHLDYAPLLRTHWVGQSVHERAVAIYAVGGRGNPSLVDVTSFEVMRQLAIDTASLSTASSNGRGSRQSVAAAQSVARATAPASDRRSPSPTYEPRAASGEPISAGGLCIRFVNSRRRSPLRAPKSMCDRRHAAPMASATSSTYICREPS